MKLLLLCLGSLLMGFAPPAGADDLAGYLAYEASMTRDLDAKSRLYARIVDESRDEAEVQRALWRLAVLELEERDPPRAAEAVKHLETLLARFPRSEWVPQAAGTLIPLYEGERAFAKAASAWELILNEAWGIPLSLWLPDALRCAEAFERAEDMAGARRWYEAVVKRGNAGGPEAAKARGKLESLRDR
jgi:hypothetical protein